MTKSESDLLTGYKITRIRIQKWPIAISYKDHKEC